MTQDLRYPGIRLLMEDMDCTVPRQTLHFNALHAAALAAGHMQEMGDTVQEEADRFAALLSSKHEAQRLLGYLIRELLRNVPEHSGADYGEFCAHRSPEGLVELAVCDSGVGIRASLRQNAVHKVYVLSHRDALDCAIQPGISKAFRPSGKNPSRSVWANSGFGLYMVREIVRRLGGSFLLASGSDWLFLGRDGQTAAGQCSLTGTAVAVSLYPEQVGSARNCIAEVAAAGEVRAKTIRNAFKTASYPSKNLISD